MRRLEMNLMAPVVAFVVALFVAGLFWILSAVALWAEARLALVVGNSNYAAVSSLDNPVNDAELIGGTLEGLGFEVTLVTDGSQVEMKRAIAQFGRRLRGADKDAVGLFYYAGHGVQSFGNNYLLPVDLALEDAADLDLEAVEAQSVLRQMASARNATNIVILDACRDNPFVTIPELNDNGLAEMQAPTGTFLAYATAPGDVALDGAGANSPFSAALAEEILAAGQPVEQVLKRVRRRVLEETSGLQTPWDSSSLVNDFQFVPAGTLSVEEQLVEMLWLSAKTNRDAAQLTFFLNSYGDSVHAPEARALLAEINGAGAVQKADVAATGPATGAATGAAGDARDETEVFEAALQDATGAGLQAYLRDFPDGRYRELAQMELAALNIHATSDPDLAAAPVVSESEIPTPAPTDKPLMATTDVTFTGALSSAQEAVDGFSLSSLVNSTPIFPPIEGIPEEMWKDQTCSNCHSWTQAALCTQSKTYLTASADRSLAKQHPFGGAMKQAMRHWAEADCP